MTQTLNPTDPGFVAESIEALLSNAGGLLLGVLLLLAIMVAISLSGGRPKESDRAGRGPGA
ncbi:MAG: hypothetical protein ACTS3F_03300 [Phycisphaerales bacterium]